MLNKNNYHFISSVKKNKNDVVEYVKFYANKEEKFNPLNPPIIAPVLLVVQLIEGNYKFRTVLSEGTQIILGAKVIIEEINGKKFLKTIPNKNHKDNLDNLPTF